MADEFVVVVLVSLVPSVVPIPVMFLGLFTSGIQALIFATLAAAYIGESMEGHESRHARPVGRSQLDLLLLPGFKSFV